MSGPVDRGADVGDAACGAGRRLVMDDHHRLDRVCGILCEPGLNLGRISAAAPITGNEINLDPKAARHLAPQSRKVAGLHHQDLVARRKRIDDRGLPGACP